MLLSADKFHEECGVFGVYSSKKANFDLAEFIYYGLINLQHRGQESAGISISHNSKIKTHKNLGQVSKVFSKNDLENLKGNIAIGHVRYSTCGENSIENSQPLQENNFALAHNGNIVNADILKENLSNFGELFCSTSDSEILLKILKPKQNKEINFKNLNKIKGAYSIIMIANDKLIGIRDPYGIRPLILGKTQNNSFILSSESCAIENLGGEIIRDIAPGEIIIIDENGLNSFNFANHTKCGHCAFEYIYFARPDSVIDEISVYETRINAGKFLAKQRKIKADIVIGVPDSGIPAAIGYAKESGISYDIGFIKNKYIGRSFIAPSDELRKKVIMAKLNALKFNITGKRVIVVDDSLVRGNTSKILIQILRNAGAKEVHFMSASPAVKYSCYFGIDTAHRNELIASKFSTEEIRKEIGADSLEFLSIENLHKALRNSKNKAYCMGCFNGIYPINPRKKEEND